MILSRMATNDSKSYVILPVMIMGIILSAQGKNLSPNIVMILADDLGSRDMGYVESDISTPYLDRLAAEGVKLTNHYVQSTCAPSRSELMTGRYEINMGVQLGMLSACQDGGMPLQYNTMADYLKTAGYSTHAVGKWHLGFSRKEFTPLYRGFDTFYGILGAHADHFTYELCYDPAGVCPALGCCGYALLDGEVPDYSAIGTYSTLTYTNKAVEVIRNSSKSEDPMFLYLSYTVPHTPIQSPGVYYDKYVNIENDHRRQYAGMVSAMDEGVRNVTRALIEEGLWENTVLIFFSDNGANVTTGGTNWPLRGSKKGWWEGGIKSNAFVTSPLFDKSRQGKTSSDLMHITDWLPTVAEIAGIHLDERLGLDGVSQWSVIKDGAIGLRNEILHNIDENKDSCGPRISNGTFDTNITAAIRVGDYKLLSGEPGQAGWYTIMGESFEGYSFPELDNKTLWLYNVAEDPNELVDLSEAMPEKVRELLDRLVYYDTYAKPAVPLSLRDFCVPSFNNGFWGPGPWLTL